MSGDTEHETLGHIDPPLLLTSTASLSCSHCGKTFQRREHRDRHVLRHTGARPFVCQICNKSFSRNDTLVRHQILHAGSDLNQERNLDSGPSSRRRRIQACLSCARVKQRCEGGTPCARCIVKRLECCYVSTHAPVRATASPVPGPRAGDSEPSLNQSLVETHSVLQSRPTDDMEQYPVFTPMSILQGRDTATAATSPSLGFSVQDLTLPTLAFDHDTVPNNLTTDSAFPFNLPWPMEGLDFSTEDITFSTMLTNTAIPHAEEQRFLASKDIRPMHSRMCPSFPEPRADSSDTVEAEMYGHISQLPAKGIKDFNAFCQTQQEGTASSANSASSATIPTGILHAFVELYFEHFDSQFPLLHPSRLDDRDMPWVLLLSVAAIGSHYSTLKEAPEYTVVLTELLERAVESMASVHMVKADISVIQATFMLHILRSFSGSLRDKIVYQQQRGVLATFCQDLLRSQDGLGGQDRSPRPVEGDTHSQVEEKWLAWLALEEQVRTLNCVRGSCLNNAPLHKLRTCFADCSFSVGEHVVSIYGTFYCL